MTAALTIAAALVVGYVAVAAVLWHFQERIVFQPSRAMDAAAADGLSRLSIEARDGTALFALVVGQRGAGSPPILAFHGNAVVARWLIPWAREAARRFNTCVILAEYRGYDHLAGRPTYLGSQLDADAAFAVACRHVSAAPSEFVLYGHSLGTAVATELASRQTVRSLVLESPFTSARDMVARWPIVGLRAGWSLISRVHFDTASLVRNLGVPVHVAHGERDLVIPVRMGREVFAAAKIKGGLLILPTADHNNVAQVGGEEYWKWVGNGLGL